jgi:hypothetical protein
MNEELPVGGEEEIEITEEMIEAGTSELKSSYDPFDGSPGLLTSGDIVTNIFTAMMQARHPTRPVDLLCYVRGSWKLLEAKPAPETGIRVKLKAPRRRKDQVEQDEFIAKYHVPVVRTTIEALEALGLCASDG